MKKTFNGIFRDLYIVLIILAAWEILFEADLLFQSMRIALAAVTVILLLVIPYKTFIAPTISPSTPSHELGTRRTTPGGRPLPPNSNANNGSQVLPKTQKTTTSGRVGKLIYCRSEMQGWRANMEDAAAVDEFVGGGTDSSKDGVPGLKEWSFFAVFDGHGGAAVSRRLATELSTHFYEVCEEKYPKSIKLSPHDIKFAIGEAFARMDNSLRRSSVNGELDFVGSTAVVTIINATTIICANIGDSRAILSRHGTQIPLSNDHKPELPGEKQRIEKAGGSVSQIGPCNRIDGWGLNLSRAFGDFHYKQRTDLEPWEQKVSAEPEIQIVEMNPFTDTFFVLACDGVFELLKNQDVIDFVHENIKKKHNLDTIVEDLLNQCISPNLLVTQGKGGDNVSVVVVKLPGGEEMSDSDQPEVHIPSVRREENGNTARQRAVT